jgi:hypothetical protein
MGVAENPKRSIRSCEASVSASRVRYLGVGWGCKSWLYFCAPGGFGVCAAVPHERSVQNRALIGAESVVPMCTQALVDYVFVPRMQFGSERQKGAESGVQACSLALSSTDRCESVVPMCTRALVVYVFVPRRQFGSERQKGAESGVQACSLASDVSADRCESAVPMCTQAGVMLVCA